MTDQADTTEAADTRAMLRDSLARYLADHYGFDQRRRLLDEARLEAPLWRGLGGGLGIAGATLPEAAGGMGGSFLDALAIMETLGDALAAEPYLSSVVIGAGVLARAGGDGALPLLARIAAGEAVIAFAHDEPHGRFDATALHTTIERGVDGGWVLSGRKAVVQCSPWADHLLVSARNAGTSSTSLLLADARAPGIVRRDYRTLDGGWASELRFDGVALPAGAVVGEAGAAQPLLERVLDEATLAVCAEAVGVLRRLMTDTADYIRQRRQFGVPISSFQVLQHRLVDMHIALEQARALTWAAAARIDAAPAQRAAAVSSAKVMTGRACRAVGQGAVQLHGGMGMTDELAIGHYFKRATQIELSFGSTDQHLRRVDRLAGAA
ncbi:acyl-CoA dehydrogenase family protein [Quisquiliibacterium transsilvanicum]|uniref:Alkylation response protein AidB-like acyl-CoA dehydrogenase n=1 Tax=Quisquiliibacterium transsilvanicum TaxID=1549638 RepID=A0A7W8HIP3_9BURK|nr:acyl-CoA dehydrogenase family protein [Quisquiliibacterium transsilvanicum]MBB5272809.1 alkylation response protein AidB-like acyl-CoA dehydrogenase [Quisquiliibacterium transsilvanicum]